MNVSLARRIAAFALPVALLAGLVTATTSLLPTSTESAQAASTSGFDAGQIISDATFYNTGTMTAASIQAFLATEVPTCKTGATCLRNYSQSTASRAADSYCKAYAGATGETAATIVYKVGQACGINPQVLLTTLQKEQGLVSATAPSASAFTTAMGYGCPDTAACNSLYYGFFNQVYSAARQFQVYAKNAASFRYRAGFTNVIQYNPSASCGSASVYIENQATASLYNYTPYTPNAASLAAGYGSATCGAYGNRNFYLYFTDYFGDPTGLLQAASFENGSTAGWLANGTLRRAIVNDASTAHDGASYLATNTVVTGGSMLQTVSRQSTATEQATATVWVRAQTGTVTGRLIVWGLGGQNESATQSYSVGTTWTKVSVTLPFSSVHTTARIQVSEATVNATAFLDDASLVFSAAPPKQNLLTNASFESGLSPWAAGNGAITSTTATTAGTARDGKGFGSATTTVAGRSLAQAIPITPAAGTQYVFTAYVRSASAAKPYAGSIRLWALGGSSRTSGAATFSAVNATWTKVTATVDTGSTGATSLKAEVYLNTLGTALWVDSASLAVNQLTQGSFEGGTAPWNRSSTAAINWAVYQAAGVPSGSWYLQTNTATAGTSLTQDVARQPLKGSTYTASIWIKSGGATAAKGRLALWALGGTTAVASQPFTSTAGWTQILVTLPVATADVTTLRVEIYLDSVKVNLNLDAALLY